MGPPCFCKIKCRDSLLGREDDIFNTFWNIGDYDKQNLYLLSRFQYHGTLQSVNTPTRNSIFQYTVQIGHNINVCKQEFLAVHGLQFSKKKEST